MEINDVIDSTILELNEIFGKEYKYYPQNIGQAMEVPCFFVKYINGDESLLVGKRYLSQSHFVIHAHVKDDLNKEIELNKIATRLYNLDYIKLKNGNLIELKNRNININDDVVFYYFDVNVHLIKTKQEEIINMEDINMNEGVKNNA